MYTQTPSIGRVISGKWGFPALWRGAHHRLEGLENAALVAFEQKSLKLPNAIDDHFLKSISGSY